MAAEHILVLALTALVWTPRTQAQPLIGGPLLPLVPTTEPPTTAPTTLDPLLKKTRSTCFRRAQAPDSVLTLYEGKMATTRQGYTCMNWLDRSPHDHHYRPQDFSPWTKSWPEVANFCRDPAHLGQPWCFTTNPDVIFDYCDVPHCDGEISTAVPNQDPSIRATSVGILVATILIGIILVVLIVIVAVRWVCVKRPKKAGSTSDFNTLGSRKATLSTLHSGRASRNGLAPSGGQQAAHLTEQQLEDSILEEIMTNTASLQPGHVPQSSQAARGLVR